MNYYRATFTNTDLVDGIMFYKMKVGDTIAFSSVKNRDIPNYYNVNVGDAVLLYDGSNKFDTTNQLQYVGVGIYVAKGKIPNLEKGFLIIKKIIDFKKKISLDEASRLSNKLGPQRTINLSIEKNIFDKLVDLTDTDNVNKIIEFESNLAVHNSLDFTYYYKTNSDQFSYYLNRSEQSEPLSLHSHEQGENSSFVDNSINNSSFSSTTEEEPEELEETYNEVDPLNQKIKEHLLSKNFLGDNFIFYGIPGCGKSHYIKELLTYDGVELNNNYYSRVLFHPEYTYSDFIGQIMPIVSGQRITYEFKLGAFTQILLKALKDSQNEYFMIIEELNRGNAPAIFGDFFQLLDRDKNNRSEYSITNLEILNSQGYKKLNLGALYIPSNLTIFASMNTSDQNVFALDTAFKRRFQTIRIKNNGSDLILQSHINRKSYLLGEFLKALNVDILEVFKDDDLAEDKLLGNYFFKEKDLNNIDFFSEKLISYLWNDVAKINRSKFFNVEKVRTLDEAIDLFKNNEELTLFSEYCENLKKLFERVYRENINED